jgi:phage terminase large subunit GpA-like protein
MKFLLTDIAFFAKMNDAAHTKKPLEKISEYVEGNRILPPGGPRPGPFSFDVNPFMKPLCDMLAPFSPVQRLYILKGVQTTCTTSLIENPVAYYIGENPVEQLLVSATGTLLKEWVEIRLEPLLDSLKLRDKIFAQFGNQNNRKSGDTQEAKFYAGGALHLATARSAPQQRMKSKQIIYIDEADAAPRELSTGEGNYLGPVEGRQSTYGSRKKLVILSTPNTFEDSLIWARYCTGNQLHLYYPCPHCGTDFTPMTVDTENQAIDWSLFHAEIDGDTVIDCWLECPHCQEKIFNHHKAKMFKNCEWKPHAKGIDEFTKSAFIPAIHSPVGMLHWKEFYQKYLEALQDKTLMPGFFNLYLGFPFKEIGERPELAALRELRSGYKSGTVPEGVLFLTAAIDVQRGQKRAGQKERIEIEVKGHGAGYRRWTIKHWVIEGDTKDAYAGAWEELDRQARSGALLFKRADGMEFFPRLILVDSGDGMFYDVVYAFTDRWGSTYPSKGFGRDGLKRRRGEKADDATSDKDFKRFAVRKMKEGNFLYEISTNYYKKLLYGCLKKRRNYDGSLPIGFHSFPQDTTDNFFKQLTAEEMLSNGTFKDTQKPHEALDLSVLNMAAGDAVIEGLVEACRQAARDSGKEAVEAASIDKTHVLRTLEQETRVKPVL